MPVQTTQMVFDAKDLNTLVEALDDLVLEYDMLLAREFEGYVDDRLYALALKDRVVEAQRRLGG